VRVTPGFYRSLIESITPLQRNFRRRFQQTFVFLADEFYLRAGIPLPARGHYGRYPQIEDGVGMVRRFVSAARSVLRGNLAKRFDLKPGSLRETVETGELFFPILSELNNQLTWQLK